MITDCRWLIQSGVDHETNIGTSSVTGGTTISATLVERKIRVSAKAAEDGRVGGEQREERREWRPRRRVTRKLFHIQRG